MLNNRWKTMRWFSVAVILSLMYLIHFVELPLESDRFYTVIALCFALMAFVVSSIQLTNKF